MTPKERLEHFVALTMEAWDKTVGRDLTAVAASSKSGSMVTVIAGLRLEFEAAVRERLAQGVQAWALDADLDLGRREKYGRHMELIGVGGDVDAAIDALGDEEGPEWGPHEQAKLDALSSLRARITEKISRTARA